MDDKHITRMKTAHELLQSMPAPSGSRLESAQILSSLAKPFVSGQMRVAASPMMTAMYKANNPYEYLGPSDPHPVGKFGMGLRAAYMASPKHTATAVHHTTQFMKNAVKGIGSMESTGSFNDWE